MDGCGNDVVESFDVSQTTIDATLGDGQPGRWRVSWRVVSGIDGHATTDSYAFEVAGQKDCSKAAAPENDAGDAEGETADGDGLGALLPIGMAAVVLVGGALLFRRISGPDR